METTFKEDYYSNGKLKYKNQFLNGEKHGEQLGYHENGTLIYKNQFLNGKLHGEQLEYYYSGELWYKEEYYINDKKVSEKEWITYQPKPKTQSLTDMYV